MNNWFECKISYEKTMENGMQKKVTEAYLVDGLSFTETKLLDVFTYGEEAAHE